MGRIGAEEIKEKRETEIAERERERGSGKKCNQIFLLQNISECLVSEGTLNLGTLKRGEAIVDVRTISRTS